MPRKFDIVKLNLYVTFPVYIYETGFEFNKKEVVRWKALISC